MSVVLVPVLVVVLGLVVPVGVRLLGLPRAAPLELWVCSSLPAAAAVLLPAGPVAVAFTMPLLLLCAVLLLNAGPRIGQLRLVPSRTVAALSAAGSLGVAAGALLIDRAGLAPLWGFDAQTWRLTVLHFAVAGFAGSLLAGMCFVASPSRLAATGCWFLPAGNALVATGHLTGDRVELAGTAVLTVGLLATSAATWRLVRGRFDDEAQLLTVAATVPFVSMALALSWALGQAADLPNLTRTQTAATHGVANALGFALCGLLGWTTRTKELL